MQLRVLLADADDVLRATYQKYLQQRGMRVSSVGDALTCLKELRRGTADVFVLDPAIPWGGGDGILALMYEDPAIRPVPVIILTYGRDREVLYRVAAYPVSDFQIKPLLARALASRIEAIAGPRPHLVGCAAGPRNLSARQS